MAESAQPQLSPDRQWWWDGSEWKPTQISEDKHWWWDGSKWWPMPAENGVAAAAPSTKEEARQQKEAAKQHKQRLNQLHDSFKKAEREYQDRVKAAQTTLREAQQARGKLIQTARDNLKRAQEQYRKRISDAERSLRNWTNPGSGRRIESYHGVTVFEHEVATPQGRSSILGAQATVDTAGNLAVTKRVTLTRLMAGGIVGGLLFQKKEKNDSRELYLLVETPTVASAIKCPPDEGLKARQVAAKINTAAATEARFLEQRESAIPRAEQELRAAKADTAAVDGARAELQAALDDTASKEAVSSARANLAVVRASSEDMARIRDEAASLGDPQPPSLPVIGLPQDKLNENEARMLQQMLQADEKVLAACVSDGGQALVATDTRLILIKQGLRAGSGKGQYSWLYHEIEQVQMNTGFGGPALEIGTGSLALNGVKGNSAMSAPNAVTGAAEWKYQELEALIAERSEEARSLLPEPEPAPEPVSDESEPAEEVLAEPLATDLATISMTNQEGGEETTSPPPDRLEQLHRLGELRQAEILTEEEFQAEKARILNSTP